MATVAVEKIYCIDTSALIDVKSSYPEETFPEVWSNMSKLIADGRLRAPNEVFKEITKGDDKLVVWVKKHQQLFIKPNRIQTDILSEILGVHPKFLEYDREFDADPWVLVLAKYLRDTNASLFEQRVFIVSHEKIVQGRTKIPDVCRYYKFPCIKALDMFREEGWKF